MSTRSVIGIVNNNGSVECIYCHNDGYPSGVGAMLERNYPTKQQVKALLKLGDLSTLGCTPSNVSGTVAYGRDRREYGQNSKTFENKEELIEKAPDLYWAEYIYLLGEEGWETITL